MGMFEKENIEDYSSAYRSALDSSMDHERIMKDSKPFKAVDGTYHPTMEDATQYTDAYWQCKNPFIIDKDSELFSAPLTQEVFDRILASPTYRSLIDVLEERVMSQRFGEDEAKRVK